MLVPFKRDVLCRLYFSIVFSSVAEFIIFELHFLYIQFRLYIHVYTEFHKPFVHVGDCIGPCISFLFHLQAVLCPSHILSQFRLRHFSLLTSLSRMATLTRASRTFARRFSTTAEVLDKNATKGPKLPSGNDPSAFHSKAHAACKSSAWMFCRRSRADRACTSGCYRIS